MIRTGFKTVSGAGPVGEQPHGLLAPTSAVTGDGPAAGRGRGPRRAFAARWGGGAPRSRPPAIGFETSSRGERAPAYARGSGEVSP